MNIVDQTCGDSETFFKLSSRAAVTMIWIIFLLWLPRHKKVKSRRKQKSPSTSKSSKLASEKSPSVLRGIRHGADRRSGAFKSDPQIISLSSSTTGPLKNFQIETTLARIINLVMFNCAWYSLRNSCYCQVFSSSFRQSLHFSKKQFFSESTQVHLLALTFSNRWLRSISKQKLFLRSETLYPTILSTDHSSTFRT